MGSFTLARRFRSDSRGNVAVVFAAILLPVIAVVAGALDYGRASKARDQLAHAAEGAAQVASSSLDLDRDRLAKLVRAHLDANLPEDLREVPFEIRIPSDKKSVEIAMATSVRTTMLGIVGVTEIPVAAEGFARRALPVAPGATAPAIATRPSAPAGAFDELWRTLFGGGGPAPDLVRQLEEEARQLARSRDPMVVPEVERAPGLPDVGAIQSGEDLRRAAQQIGEQLRDLPQLQGAPAPEEVERLMRQLQRAR